MNIQLDKLKGRPRQIDIGEPFAGFPALVDLVEHGDVEFTDQIKGHFTATWAGDVVEVSGSLQTSVKLPCSRCLEEVPLQLDIPVVLSYSRMAQGSDGGEADEIELDEDDLGLIPIVGDVIDLRPELENEVIMALPQQVLCRPDCEGLCPVCGQNQNLADCQCERPVFHSGLAALKKLKLDD